MGETLWIHKDPKRIISLVPSITELLFDLGLRDQVCGVTKFCVHPQEEVKKKSVVGGTKKFRLEVIDELNPDLIIGNKEENYQEGIAMLKKQYPVWMSDVNSLEEAYQMIKSIGQICSKGESSIALAESIRKGFDALEEMVSRRLQTLYLIWNEPMMAVSNHTYINSLMHKVGLDNSAKDLPGRYPEISLGKASNLNPELVLLSSEPFPFQMKHKEKFRDLFPEAEIQFVDREMFSWYGSRMLKSIPYLREFLNGLN